MKIYKKMLSSVVSGVFISLGATLFLVLRDYNLVTASLFFSVGILLTSLYANRLFTRVVPIMTAFWKVGYRISDGLIAYMGNLIGAVMYAGILRFTRLWEIIYEPCNEIMISKMGDSNISLLILGVFCAMLVGFAVLSNSVSDNYILRVLYTMLFISSFVISGFEHVVALFFYSSVYFIGCGTGLIDLLRMICMVSIGNILGGVISGLIYRGKLV